MSKKAAKSEIITKEEAIESLERSGYLIENRLEDILINKAFIVETNTYFPDPDTEKPREIDIIACNYKTLEGEIKGQIVTCLIIECLNNPQPFALFTKEMHPLDLYYRKIHGVGLPAVLYKFIEKDDKSHPVGSHFLRLQEIRKNHHYFHTKTATQYCSFNRKKMIASNGWHHMKMHIMAI